MGELPYSIMVVADSNFENICNDSEAYINKLKAALQKRIGENLKLHTVTGRYGLDNYTGVFEVHEIDSKNKTSFIFSLENLAKADVFDELLILSIVDTDPYLNGVKTKITECEKTLSQYGYIRKEYES